MARQCDIFDECRFFEEQLRSLPATAQMYVTYYCLGNHRGCARRMVLDRLGREGVPADLYPSQTSRARQLMSEG